MTPDCEPLDSAGRKERGLVFDRRWQWGVAVFGTAAYCAFARSWQDLFQGVYDLSAAPAVFAFLGQWVAEGAAGRRGRWWLVRAGLLLPLAAIPAGREFLGWPVSGHLTDVLAIALIQLLDARLERTEKALYWLPLPVVAGIRWYLLDADGHAAAYFALMAAVCIFALALLILVVLEALCGADEEIVWWASWRRWAVRKRLQPPAAGSEQAGMEEKAYELFKVLVADFEPEALPQVEMIWAALLPQVRRAFHGRIDAGFELPDLPFRSPQHSDLMLRLLKTVAELMPLSTASLPRVTREKLDRAVDAALAEWQLTDQPCSAHVRLGLLAVLYQIHGLHGVTEQGNTVSAPAFAFVWTEKEQDKRPISKDEYDRLWRQGPSLPGPLLWVDLVRARYSVLVGGTRIDFKVTGHAKNLLCFLLRHVEKAVEKKRLKALFGFSSESKDLDRWILYLHNKTHDVLRPFLRTNHGEGRTLDKFSSDNPSQMITFCMIDLASRTSSEPERFTDKQA